MGGDKGDFMPWNIRRGKVTDFGRFVGYACSFDSRLGQIYNYGSDRVGRVGINTQYPAEFHLHPNLLASLTQGCRCRTLTKVNVSAWEGPFVDLGLDAAPQQKYPAAIDNETSGDQFRAGKMDKTAAAANLEPFMIRQDGSDLHRAAAQSTKADVLRELMLNTMVRVNWGILVSHCVHQIDALSKGEC